MKKELLLITSFLSCFLTMTLSFSQSSVSGTELYVEKNRNYESTFEGNADFKLVLKNTSAGTATYYLSTARSSKPCSNKINKKTSEKNIDLNSFLLDSNNTTFNKSSAIPKESKNKIVLNGGQSYKFNVKVVAPEGTPYNRWGCIEVKATTDNSEFNAAKTILSVFVPDPSEF